MKEYLYLALIDTSPLPKPEANQARIDTILGVVFGLMGLIAVLMLVIGGFKYIISKGDPREMAQAKNTIIYALVGLGVVIMSYTIVTFVVNNI
jgi:hypothetical protein